jgi:hypothetical protein
LKIYVAGKITDLENFKEVFQKAVEQLESFGHSIMNPALLPKGFEYNEYMHVCYAMIDVCEGIYLLDNWTESKGAMMEFDYATKMGKTIYYQSGFHIYSPQYTQKEKQTPSQEDWDERDIQRGYKRGYDFKGTDNR